MVFLVILPAVSLNQVDELSFRNIEGPDRAMLPRSHYNLIEEVFSINPAALRRDQYLSDGIAHVETVQPVNAASPATTFEEGEDQLASQHGLVAFLLVHRPDGVSHLRNGSS